MTLIKVTLILFSYNQEKFIESAAKSCIEQDYEGPLEIIFSDDFSTDSTFAILKRIAKKYDSGKHTLVVRQNSYNMGIGAHYNSAISQSNGELIFTAAGDDISHPQRISTLVNSWLANGKKSDLLTSNLLKIDIHGKSKGIIEVSDISQWKNPENWIKKRPYVVGAAHGFTRRLHLKFGNFVPDLVYEDQVMAFRATLAGGGLKVVDPLVNYREGGISQNKRTLRTASEYIDWSIKHFSRQRAQYTQIQKDLNTASRPDLWEGKMRRCLHEAQLILSLHDCNSIKEKVSVSLSSTHSTFGFRFKHLIFLSWPKLAISIQRLQQFLKQHY